MSKPETSTPIGKPAVDVPKMQKGRPSRRPFPNISLHLAGVVELVLDRVRAHFVGLVLFGLQIDVGHQLILGEHVACEQEVHVLLQLVERFAGHKLSKGHTFTNWDARPLTASQLRYAADDVRYLPLVWERLRCELESRGSLAWALRECELSTKIPARFDEESQVRRTIKSWPMKQMTRCRCGTRPRLKSSSHR